MGHTPVQPGCAAPAWLRHMSHHAPQGVSPMAQKIRVCGINMAKLVLPRAGVARRYPLRRCCLAQACGRQHRPSRRTCTPL